MHTPACAGTVVALDGHQRRETIIQNHIHGLDTRNTASLPFEARAAKQCSWALDSRAVHARWCATKVVQGAGGTLHGKSIEHVVATICAKWDGLTTPATPPLANMVETASLWGLGRFDDFVPRNEFGLFWAKSATCF